MANFDNSSRVPNGNVTEIIGTGSNDTIVLSFISYRLGGTTTGVIDGGGGTDTLDIDDVDLRFTTISGIENTILRESIANRTIDIDADQINNLGLVDVQDVTDGFLNIELYDVNDGDNADFGNFTLGDSESLSIRSFGTAGGENATFDFSGMSLSGTASLDSGIATRVRFTGGSSNDTITGSDERDIISGSFGNDIVNAGGGDDRIDGGGGDDVINGEAGNDVINDTSGTSVIDGGTGDDTITVLSSNTSLSSVQGGADNDTITVRNGSYTNNTIDGGADTDTLILENANVTGTTFAGLEMATLQETVNTFITIDASEIGNLGAITVGTLSDGILGLSLVNIDDGDVSDFSGLSLSDGQSLDVNATGGSSGDTYTADFSVVALSGNPTTNGGGIAARID
ncbi:MAG: hypothetical protein AAF830_07690, partial [Pseudomonadota bacterium]